MRVVSGWKVYQIIWTLSIDLRFRTKAPQDLYLGVLDQFRAVLATQLIAGGQDDAAPLPGVAEGLGVAADLRLPAHITAADRHHLLDAAAHHGGARHLQPDHAATGHAFLPPCKGNGKSLLENPPKKLVIFQLKYMKNFASDFYM